MQPIFHTLDLYGIVPVVVLNDAADAADVARALADGGLPCAEVTFRTAAAAKAIESIAASVPQVHVGAGTVLTVEQVKIAVAAGASFIVAPGLNRKVVEYCISQGIPVLPGVATPSDIEVALEYGLEVVKLFPAEAQGGVEYLKAIAAPYKTIRFVPTGGVQPANLLNYLKLPSVLACGGSWLVSNELIKAKKFDDIRRLTGEAIALMLGFRLMHVGVNGASEGEAQGNAEAMAALFQMPIKVGTSSIFVGTGFEMTKKKFPGEHGHLAVGTNFPYRAKAYLERRGYGFRGDTASEKDGRLVSIYLEQEIGGFAIHLLQA
jgi:2-dehydro-3-deoxyphosphogluconate aldolase / (4S)-4-hydroxy-2-oxoglutarate aldolase